MRLFLFIFFIFCFDVGHKEHPTEEVQAILQPEISTYFAHFRFECKSLKFE